jgi:putative endonuclease
MARDRSLTGGRARLAGRRGEVVSALWLMAKGYRILGFRLKTPQGEIDLLARKGRVLAVVEVKLRTSIEVSLEAVASASAPVCAARAPPMRPDGRI